MKELKTKRLVLRPMTDEEMREVIAAEKDPHMKKAFGEMLAGSEADPKNRLFYTSWEIRQKGGAPVGSLCFKGPAKNGEVEIGYGIDSPYERQGYATEAVKAAIDWAFSTEGVFFVTAETELGNAASQRVLEKLGFTQCGEGVEGPRFELEKPASQWMTFYMCIGMSLGVSLGMTTDNLSTGIAIGMPIGLAIGSALDAADRKKRAEFKAAREKETKPAE